MDFVNVIYNLFHREEFMSLLWAVFPKKIPIVDNLLQDKMEINSIPEDNGRERISGNRSRIQGDQMSCNQTLSDSDFSIQRPQINGWYSQ